MGHVPASEFQPQHQLDLPRSFVERAERGKSRLAPSASKHCHSKIAGPKQSGRIVQVGVVECVKRVGAERDSPGLPCPAERERTAQ